MIRVNSRVVVNSKSFTFHWREGTVLEITDRGLNIGVQLDGMSSVLYFSEEELNEIYK
jgi:hypothetical protein